MQSQEGNKEPEECRPEEQATSRIRNLPRLRDEDLQNRQVDISPLPPFLLINLERKRSQGPPKTPNA